MATKEARKRAWAAYEKRREAQGWKRATVRLRPGQRVVVVDAEHADELNALLEDVRRLERENAMLKDAVGNLTKKLLDKG